MTVIVVCCQRQWQLRGFGFHLCLSVCFVCAIARKLMQLGSPNTTLKCSTMIPGKPFIWGKGQRSRSRVRKTVLAWVFALLWVLDSFSFFSVNWFMKWFLCHDQTDKLAGQSLYCNSQRLDWFDCLNVRCWCSFFRTRWMHCSTFWWRTRIRICMTTWCLMLWWVAGIVYFCRAAMCQVRGW